jgi:hypothetical protein
VFSRAAALYSYVLIGGYTNHYQCLRWSAMSDKKITDDTLRFLIEQKMAYINSTVNVCMLWWVSSIAFCGTVLVTVWSNQGKLLCWSEPKEVAPFCYQGRFWYLAVLGVVLFVFFSFIADFGFMIAKRLLIVQKEIAVLAKELNYTYLDSKLIADGLNPKGGFFKTEIVTFNRSMKIGALSFTLVFAVWIIFWSYLLFALQPIYSLVSVTCFGLWIWIYQTILPQWWQALKEVVQPERVQKESETQRVTVESKRRYIVPLIFAGIFIYSTTILLLSVSGVFHATSDVPTWINVITSIVSAIGTIVTTILAVRGGRGKDRKGDETPKGKQED